MSFDEKTFREQQERLMTENVSLQEQNKNLRAIIEGRVVEQMKKSPYDQVKELIEKITEVAPYGPTSAEFIAEAIDLECTGEDDHDLEKCDKCHRIRRRIVSALRSGYWQQTSHLAYIVSKAKVPGAVGLDGRSPVFDLHKVNETLLEVNRILSWMKS